MADQTLAPLAGNTLAIGSASLPVGDVTTNGAITDPAGNASTPAQIKAARDAVAALGNMAAQSADNVAITGGSITGITDLAVADGGTGASTAAGAVVNLLPAMASNEGKVLAVASGETTTEWVAVGGSGTVTSVDVSGGTTGLTASGGPVTASGTLTLGGTLAVANGGTGATTATAASLALLPAVAGSAGKVLAVNGTADGFEYIAAGGTGTVTSVAVSGGTTGLTTSGGPITGAGTVTLAGTLAVASGGTGSTTASGARTALGLAISTDVPALAHTHAGTTNGNKLAQANTHESPDTDNATSSLHHTLGTGANQAAAGNHLHTGTYVPMLEPVEVLDITTGETTPSIAYRKGYLAIDAAVEIQLPVTTSMGNSTCWEYSLRILHNGTNVPTMATGWRKDANDVSAGIPFSTDASAEDILVLVVEKDASGNLKTAAGLAFGDLT